MMKKQISLLLICIIMLFCSSCQPNTHDTGSDSIHSEDFSSNDFGYMPDQFDHPIFLDESIKQTDMTIDEKLDFLNNLQTMDITSAFVLVNAYGWQSFEVNIDSYPDILNQIISIYTSPDSDFEVFDGDIDTLGSYNSYITFTDSNSYSFTLFNRDYALQTDEIIGEFSNGEPWYNTIDSAVIAFDGDYFLIKNVYTWWSISRISGPHKTHYEVTAN